MLPIRRLALVQANVVARTVLRPSSTQFLSSGLHTSRLAAFPLPTSTDDVSGMSSKNTAGQGLNEAGSGNQNVPNAHNPTRTTSNSGRSSQPPTPSTTTPPPPSNPSTPTADEVKQAVKTGARKTRAKAHNAADEVSEAARHSAAKASTSYESTKEDVRHAVKTRTNRVKSTARDAMADSSAAPIGGTEPAAIDTEAMRAKARETASSVKAGLSSVVEKVKDVAHNVAETVKSTTSTATSKARAATAGSGQRLQAFGDRMEAKFERIGTQTQRTHSGRRAVSDPPTVYRSPARVCLCGVVR